MNQKCVGCDSQIPYGAIKCPVCGAPIQQSVVTIIPPADNKHIERVVWEGTPDWKAYTIWFILAALLIPSIFGTVIVVIGILLDKFGHQYKVTTKRIICVNGNFSKRSYELDINDIRSTNVTQTIIGRMLGVGSIEFATAAGPFKEAVIVKIDNPEYLKERIRTLRQV